MTSKTDSRVISQIYKRHKPEGRTLICGSRLYPGGYDRRSWYPDHLGLDIQDGDGVDFVHDLENNIPWREGFFNHVDCCSVLEHVSRPWLAADTIEKAMRKDATLLLSVPFIWREHGYPSDYFRFTINAVEVLFPSIDWIELDYYDSKGSRVSKPAGINLGDQKYLERCEVVGFGVRK